MFPMNREKPIILKNHERKEGKTDIDFFEPSHF